MSKYKLGAHCQLDYITRAEWEDLPKALRAELTEEFGSNVVGRRRVDVVKELRSRGNNEVARMLVQCLRRPGAG